MCVLVAAAVACPVTLYQLTRASAAVCGAVAVCGCGWLSFCVFALIIMIVADKRRDSIAIPGRYDIEINKK